MRLDVFYNFYFEFKKHTKGYTFIIEHNSSTSSAKRLNAFISQAWTINVIGFSPIAIIMSEKPA